MLTGLVVELKWLIKFVKDCVLTSPSKPRVLKKTLWPRFLKQFSMVTHKKMLPGITYIFTDGSCRSDFSGGWSWIAVKDRKIVKRGSGHKRNTDSQFMEVLAVVKALEQNTGKTIIVSDSAHVCCGMRNYYNNGLKTDKDLWRELFALTEDKTRDVSAEWIKAHNGAHFNEEADRAAQEESASIFTGQKKKRRRKV
jgi:ribonuclease HI